MRKLLLLVLATCLLGVSGLPCQLTERDQVLIFGTIRESWLPEETVESLRERLSLRCTVSGKFTVIEFGHGSYLIQDAGWAFPRWVATGVKLTEDPFDSVREYFKRYAMESRIQLWERYYRAPFDREDLSGINALIHDHIEWETLNITSNDRLQKILSAKVSAQDQEEGERLLSALVRKHLCSIGVLPGALVSMEIPKIGVADETVLVKVVYRNQRAALETLWLNFYVNLERVPFVAKAPI